MSHAPSVDEVLAELDRLQRESHDGPDGFTVSDVAARYGCARRTAGARVTDWVRRGLAEFAGNRRAKNIVGVEAIVPVYRPCRRSRGSC